MKVYLNKVFFSFVIIGGFFITFSLSAETLNYDEIRQKVLKKSPLLSAANDYMKSAKAEIRQAGAFPNSELEISFEEFGKNEIEAMITQPIEIGGKRKARIELAEKSFNAEAFELDIKRLFIESEIIRRCAPILALQKKIAILDSLASVMEESLNTIKRRQKAGAAMEADALRTEMEIDELLIEKTGFEKQLRVFKIQLAALWGRGGESDTTLACALIPSLKLPKIKEIEKKVSLHPEIMLMKLKQETAVAEMQQLKAEAFPEVAVSGGYVRNVEDDENAVLAGISISLPFFNRNQGAVLAKKYEAAAIEKDVQALLTERITDSGAILSEIENTREAYRVLTKKLRPKAENVYALLERYYKLGNISILEVLESRRNLLEIKLRSIDLITEHSLLAADLMELTGIPIQVIQ